MPMDFPDESLESHAKLVGFRQKEENETIEQYREAFADYMVPIDFIESQEIRNKVGWDKWSDKQNLEMLLRATSKNQK